MKDAVAFTLLCLSSFGRAQENSCPPPNLETVDNFSLDQFISKRWYVHEQAVTQYTPLENFYCSYAEYTRKKEPSLLGYTVDVKNYAQDLQGNEFGGPLCAFQDGEEGTDASKLNVAPCVLPKIAAGPYWIIYYDEGDGLAVVSGGSPDIKSDNGECKTGDGINNSGLWIFLRAADCDETKIATAKEFLSALNYDLSVLSPVSQTGCVYGCDDGEQACKDSTEEFQVLWHKFTLQ